jgi:hypothetical protein
MPIQRAAGLFFLFALVSTGILFFLPHVSFAQASGASEVATAAGLGSRSLLETIGTIINVFLGLLGVIFLILFIYAGFVWMTAGGDDKKVETAKRILISATVGLAICLAAYGIATFVMNYLGDATGTGRGNGGVNGTVSVERLSGSLGSGPIKDHYPKRNDTDIARNTRIMITFKSEMDKDSVADGTVIYPSASGKTAALTDTLVTAAPDGKTFVFDPAEYLGSPTENVEYTVDLSPDLENADGEKVFVGSNAEGYEWSFETGTTIDLSPPTVMSVTPGTGGTYDQNILVQVTFSEPVDPTSSTGTTESFTNISVTGVSGAATSGTYETSNGYKTVTFVPSQSCGVNSCNEEIFCLPGGQLISSTVSGATVGANPPQADAPYDGIVDMAGNALDGNGDGTAGDDFTWNFTTSNSVNTLGPAIASISPNIEAEDVPLDQDIEMVFSDVLMSSSVSSENIFLSNKEAESGTSHEQWFRFDTDFLNASGGEITSSSEIPVGTKVTIPHGTFLESVDGKSYSYGVEATERVRNQYQNCFAPAEGPTDTGGSCLTSASAPYCCNGVASSAACSLF